MHSEFIKISVGIDVSATTLVVAVMEYNLLNQSFKRLGRHSFDNTAKGHKSLLKWARSKSSKQHRWTFAVEATGVYHEEISYYLSQQGEYLSVLLPNLVKAYARSLNLSSKTDLTDAEMIGRYAGNRTTTKWISPSDKQMEVKRLSRQRAIFCKQRAQLKNQLHAAQSAGQIDRFIIKNYQNMVKGYDEAIKKISKQLDQAIKTDQKYRQINERLQSVPGIGPITAATLIGETNGFELFTCRPQLVKFCGLDVVANQSGTSINGPGRISKTGSGRIRAVLHMAAWSAIRKEGPIKAYYDRIRSRVGIPNKALVAVQRKLLLVAFACVKNDTDYDPEFYKKVVASQTTSHCAYTSEESVA